MQRIGRGQNNRMDEPSKAYLVPGNRFEMLECRAALDAVEEARAGHAHGARIGAPDVLAPARPRHGSAPTPSIPLDLYDETNIRRPLCRLSWEDFEAVVDYVATGGYALGRTRRFAKILKGADGKWRVRDARVAPAIA